MKTKRLLLSVAGFGLMLGCAYAAPLDKVLSPNDVPAEVKMTATSEAGKNRISKYRLSGENYVADAGNGKDRRLLEITPEGKYIAWSRPIKASDLPEGLTDKFINTVSRKACPTCPMVRQRMSNFISAEEYCKVESGSEAVFRVKSKTSSGTTVVEEYKKDGSLIGTVK